MHKPKKPRYRIGQLLMEARTPPVGMKLDWVVCEYKGSGLSRLLYSYDRNGVLIREEGEFPTPLPVHVRPLTKSEIVVFRLTNQLPEVK